MTNPTDKLPNSVEGFVAQAQELIGINSSASDAVLVQKQIADKAAEYNKGAHKVAGLDAQCGRLLATFTNSAGEQSALAVDVRGNNIVIDGKVASIDQKTERTLSEGIVETGNSQQIKGNSHTVDVGIGANVCLPHKLKI